MGTQRAGHKGLTLTGAALFFCLLAIPAYAASPKLTPIGNKTVFIDIPLDLTISATDPDNHKISYYVYPAGDLNHDGFLTSLDALRLIRILNIYPAPIRPQDPGWDPEMDINNDKNITSKDVLLAINLLNKGKTKLPEGINLNADTGQFNWRPGASYIGENRLTFVASDGNLKDAESIVITVKTGAVLSISVNPKVWDINETEVNKTITMSSTEKLTVTNNGNIQETFTLSVVNPSNWSASTTPGPNTYVLSGLFCNINDVPIPSAFNQEDTLTTIAKRATQTIFGYNQATANGALVEPQQARSLYLQFKSPIITAQQTEQQISVIVSCQTP